MATTDTTPPIARDDTASVRVNGAAQAAGDVLANDTDAENSPLTVTTVNGQAGQVGVAIQGTYGSLVLNASGQYTYVLATSQPNVQAIAPGQTVTDVFHYTISDGFDHSVVSVVNQNLLTWSEAFDNAAWVKFWGGGPAPTVTADAALDPLGATKTADQVTLSGGYTGLFFAQPITGQVTFSLWVRLVSGDGHFDLSYFDGSTSQLQSFTATSAWQRVSFTFTGNGNKWDNIGFVHDETQTGTGTFQIWGAQLNPGAAPTDYLKTAGQPAQTTETTSQVVGADLTVSITGPQPPAAPVAVGDQAVVAVGGATQAAGDVLANDSASQPLTVTAVNGQAAGVGATVAGTYGSLVLGADGHYTYVLNSALATVKALAPGQTVTEVFQYTVSDGSNYTVSDTAVSGQNFLIPSEAFDDSHWTKFAASGAAPTVSANVALDPFGVSKTAEQITLSGAYKGVYFQEAISGQATFSMWVRLVNGDGHFSLSHYDGSTSDTKAFVATSAWQRVSITFDGASKNLENVAFVHDAGQTGTGTFQIWGAQLNPGPTPGDYVATTNHFDAAYATTTAPAVVTANLTVEVSGPDPASVTSNALTFAGASDGVVVNLSTHQWSHATKVLPLGDSITYGWTSQDYAVGQTNTEDGYRGPLWWEFAGDSSLINFVGPETSGDVWLPDQSHAGIPNYRSDQLADLLPGMLASNRPDAILFMAGTNDIFQETAPASHVADSIDRIIDTLTALSPSTHLYVATLLPIDQAQSWQPGDGAMVATVNAAIRDAVAKAVAAGANVSLVDMSSMTLGDLQDLNHPSAAGYAKLADIWYDAMLDQQPVNGGTPDGDAHAIASGVRTVVGSADNDLLIGSSAAETISGGAGADRIVGGGGNDRLTGGAGADQFVFSKLAGQAAITDFTRSLDHIELDGFGLTQFSQLSSRISQSAGSTVIDLTSFGAQTVITLTGYTGTLTSNDIWFG
jgi:VCBS repeat-containing protein